MSADSKTFLKLSWALASATCFIFPLLFIPFDSLRNWIGQVTGDMIFGMLILAFPSSLLYLLLIGCVLYIFSPFEMPVSFYVLLWFGCFVTGYLQWFHFLPNLLKREDLCNWQSLTTLGLNGSQDANSNSKRRRTRRRKASQSQLADKRVLQFDEIRRTPLERVIGES